jgi:hypothetical protein
MTSLLKKINSSLPTEITARVYHAAAACTEIVQTAMKVVKVVIATLLAGLAIGESRYLNQHVFLYWKDVVFSMQMVALSIKGILDPEAVVDLKQQANTEHWDNQTAIFKLISEKEENRTPTYADTIARNILYFSDFVDAGLGATMALVRTMTASVLYPIGGGKSRILPGIFMIQTASVNFHLVRMGMASVGTVRPMDVLKMAWS